MFPGSTLGDAVQPTPRADGTTDLRITPDRFHEQFCADLPESQAALMAVTQRPVAQEALLEPSGDRPLWKELPSWFVFGEEDRNIPAQLEHFMARRARAHRTHRDPGRVACRLRRAPAGDGAPDPRGRGRPRARLADATHGEPKMSVTPMASEVVLEPAAQAFAEATAAPPFLYELSPEAARAVLDEVQSAPIAKLPVDDEWLVVRAGVGDVRVRIVRPAGAEGKLPVVLYMHGGGWVLGNAATHDRLVRELAVGAAAAVVFVEYDRSPEARYPVAIEQGYAVARWIVREGAANGLDAERMAIAGDSVGGNMTAALTLMASERGDVRFVHQSMYYPVTDAAMDTGSYEEFAEGYYLTAKAMAWFWDAYVPDRRAPLGALRVSAARERRAARRAPAGVPRRRRGRRAARRGRGVRRAAARSRGRGDHRPIRRCDPRLHDAQPAQRHARDACRRRAGRRGPARGAPQRLRGGPMPRRASLPQRRGAAAAPLSSPPPRSDPMNHVINVIVASPEEAYNGNAELWSGADMVAVTTIHEGQLHLRIDPRRDGRPWLINARSLADGLVEAARRIDTY